MVFCDLKHESIPFRVSKKPLAIVCEVITVRLTSLSPPSLVILQYLKIFLPTVSAIVYNIVSPLPISSNIRAGEEGISTNTRRLFKVTIAKFLISDLLLS
jgi:hypothetical protein